MTGRYGGCVQDTEPSQREVLRIWETRRPGPYAQADLEIVLLEAFDLKTLTVPGCALSKSGAVWIPVEQGVLQLDASAGARDGLPGWVLSLWPEDGAEQVLYSPWSIEHGCLLDRAELSALAEHRSDWRREDFEKACAD